MKNLEDILTFGKFKGMTVKRAIDEKYYAMKAIVQKYPNWYDEDVHDYLMEINGHLIVNKSQKKELFEKIHRENT